MTTMAQEQELQILRHARSEVLRLIAIAEERNMHYKNIHDGYTAKWYEGELDGLHKMRRILRIGNESGI